METHVSSTTADVPEAQEVVGSHGNVELVIVVEKLDEEQPQKADSNSQPVTQDNKALSSQPTKKHGLPQNSPSKQLLQETVGKQVEPCKTAQPFIKIQQNKQSAIQSPSKSESPQKILPEKNDSPLLQNSPAKELASQVDVDSTSVKDNPITEQFVAIERESSNDSQTDMNCDVSEKEHNKSISRELKSLINSAKESKIISECTKLTSKTRKSRAALDTSNSNLNVSVEADSIHGIRRSSINSQKSNSSEKSEKLGKRSMRSQNPEFVNKVKQFLNSVTGKFHKGDSDASSASDDEMVDKSKENHSDIVPRTVKSRTLNLEQNSTKVDEKSNKLRSDPYCWRCHWSIDIADEEKTPQPPLKCTVCPRSFHFRCLTGTERTKIATEKNWVCPGCMTVLYAESSETRSTAMKKISLGMLCELLKFALQRMMELNGVEPFMQTVDRAVFPDYDKYVVHPMDLSLMRENISVGLYGSTEAFLGDAHWILHNSIIFNTLQSKLTTAARALVRSCRAEMCEVEACPECYAAAHTRRPTWFTDVCSTPHVLLWAKLKGFPYWPAKAMSVSHAGLVDVRFFGAHDRAWVPARDCFLYSEKDPNNFRTKRQDIIDSMQEAEQHICNISRKYGKFVYAPFRVQFEPFKLEEQLKLMIPSFEGTVKSPVRDKRPKTPGLVKKSRSSSKGSKDGLNVGNDGSDREVSPMDTSKMSGDVDKMDEDSPIEKTQFVTSRKRRRSEPKEAGISTSDSCSKEKNRRVESNCKEQKVKKNESQCVSSSKEIARQVKEADECEEPMEADCQSSSTAAAAPEVTPKLNKETPKISSEKRKHDASPQPTKVPDKEKKAPQDTKTGPQNVRCSRSNKSINNTDPSEVENSGVDSSSTNKIDASIENNGPSGPSTGNNKNKSEETVIKTTDKEKAVESTEVDNGKGNVTESSTNSKLDLKEKENESFSPNKTIDNEKVMQNKNNGKHKKLTDIMITNQKNGTAKAGDTDTPNEDNTKGKKTNTVTPSNKNPGKEKPNEVKNDSREHSAGSAIPSNEVVEERTGVTTSPDKIVVSKVLEKNTVNKRFSIGKDNIITGKITVTPKAGGSKIIKSTKDGLVFDDETRRTLVTRKVSKGGGSPGAPALPTISCVRSMSAAPVPAATASPAAAAFSSSSSPSPSPSRAVASTKTTQITVEVDPDSSIFTPTSTDHVRNMKEAINKLQKLKSGVESPLVGRVGVRAFARITSPSEKQAKTNDVLVEIKAEPMDYEETETAERPSTVLESLRPRPIAPAAAANLREVRINKVVAGPVAAKKTTKALDVRPRAKKTFPQPKKADDGRSELTSKNSMVYIPIQPPAAQAPARAPPKPPAPAASMPAPRAPPLGPTTVSVSSVTAMAPPLAPMGPPPAPAGPGALAPFPVVPTTVHTVPFITSVNGQWTFSLQPVMSVGGIDSISSPMVNGVVERVTPTPMVVSPSQSTALVPLAPAPASLAAAPAPAPASASAAQPAAASAPPPAPAPAPMPAPPPPPPPPPPPAVNVANNVANPSSRLADAVLGEPPRLHQRPALQSPLAAGTPVADVPVPSAAGPLTAKLNQNSVKLADFFRTLLEDSLEQLEEPEGQLAALRLQLEQARWKYQHEVAELRHTQELLLVELRAAMEKEKARAVAEARRLAHQELDAAVKHAKSKQWCANCCQEAQFYCCWNTAYCDYPCQRAHWAQHYGSCTQQRAQGASSDALSGPADHARLTPADDIPVPKPSAPALTAGGKARPDRPDPAQKGPIVVSTPEEAAAPPGARAAAAAGAPPAASPAAGQLISSELCGGKRVVTSGGYLIVGGVAPRPAPHDTG